MVSIATPSFAADEVLTNASIIEMKSLGLGDRESPRIADSPERAAGMFLVRR
jgi:hypothetical protein